ncbi:family 20 glycosylhydrolase [Halosquirtibacter laminarini]|uniref:Family 20 glycosylhydrolase n=1 Tax=Halosquirtibacter laminarini TaxID=3374600 RepID=A0AC61NEQ7_9BACT|nr:family 20 glycosylhydrolase [Prolixibacteraceae bacterium]
MTHNLLFNSSILQRLGLRFISFILFLGLFSSCKNIPQKTFTKEEVAMHFVPQVNQLTVLKEKSVVLSRLKSIGCDSSLEPIALILKDRISNIQNTELDVVLDKERDITLHLDSTLSPSSYQLNIHDGRVVVHGGDIAGVYYGVQTFLQLLPSDIYKSSNKEVQESTILLPAVTINDSPHFAYRGMMLDVSRHFMPFDILLQYVDVMSQHKLNILHLHLADSQGWRIEIKSHPELVEIGSVRGISEKIPAFRHKRSLSTQPTDADPYGPFYYTQAQIKTLIQYAKVRGVEIIPEIDVPGHSRALNASLGMGCGKNKHTGDVVCASNEDNYKVLDDIFTEVAALFPSKYIHFGGDEVNFKQWKRCTKCQKFMKQHQIKSEHALQNYFVHRITEMIQSKGKHPIGWNEILGGGELPEGTMVMSWIGVKPGIEAAKRGIDVIMAPGPYCYFDMKEANNKNEPGHFWAGIVTLNDVYHYDPLWDIPKEYQKHIKGLSGALWSEFVSPEEKQFWYKSFPRLCALSEVGWTNAENKNYEDFMDRLGLYHLDRLDAQGVKYRIPRAQAYFHGKDSVVIEMPYHQANVKYTLDGSSPTIHGLEYKHAFGLKVGDKLEYTTYSPSGRACMYSSKKVSYAPLSSFTYEDTEVTCVKNELEKNSHYEIQVRLERGESNRVTFVDLNSNNQNIAPFDLKPRRTKTINVQTDNLGSLKFKLQFSTPLRGRGDIYMKKHK